MAEGKIVEYIDQKKIILSCCIKDRINKWQLLTLNNHEVSISPKRALLVSSYAISVSKPREELLTILRSIEVKRKEYMKKIVVPELWELICEEKEVFSFKDLSQLSFGKDITDDHISALVRALFSDGIYFKMKDGNFIPNSIEKVEQIKKSQELAELRAREINEGATFLKQVMNNKPPEDLSSKSSIIDVIRQLALYGKDSPDFKKGREMFSAAGIKDIGKARNILVDLNVWKEDENLDLHRLNINVDFDESILMEADRATKTELDVSGREDITHLSVFTIDGPFTRDYDDALSLEHDRGGFRLGIHISDTTPYIHLNSLLDTEAYHRASTIYLPYDQIPMLPPSLSHDALSLIKGADRGAISLFVNFDKNFEIKNYRFAPTLLRVENQLTYEYVNKIYRDDPVFSTLHQLSNALRQKRGANGALLIPLPEINFQISSSSDIEITLIEQDTPSRNIVSECMILYNWLVAKFASEIGITILYRGQEVPQERLPLNESNYIYYVFQQRRKLRPLLVDTAAQPHSGLGVDVYTNATSPLRRYLDMVVQRQISASLLKKDSVYTEEGLKELTMFTQQKLKDIFLIKRNQIRYWILKYLARQINRSMNAIVFQQLRNKYLIILTDFLFVADLSVDEGTELSLGQEIRVVVKRSYPWEDILALELVK